jgi:hypothetical protein
LNSTLSTTIIFQPENLIIPSWEKFWTSCQRMQFFLGKFQLAAGDLRSILQTLRTF